MIIVTSHTKAMSNEESRSFEGSTIRACHQTLLLQTLSPLSPCQLSPHMKLENHEQFLHIRVFKLLFERSGYSTYTNKPNIRVEKMTVPQFET